MNEVQYVKSLYQKRLHLKRMLEMLNGLICAHHTPNPVFEKLKFDLEVEILRLKLELNTMYYS